jgi:polyisoprenoid-binding protein YceI
MKLLITLCTLIFATTAFADHYKLDKAHSSVDFSVKHLGLFPVKGNFKDFSVESIKIDEKKQMIKSIVVKINTDTINTNNDDRDAHLKSKDFFNVRDDEYNVNKKYQYITFRGKNIPLNTKNIAGSLKILKTSKKVKLKSDINTLKDESGAIQTIGASISGSLNRKDYGLTWQKEETGLLAKAAGKFVGDTVTLNVNILLKKVNHKKK